MNEVPAPSLSAAVLGLLVTAVVGLLVGVVPARRATNQSILRAIRD